MQQPNVTYCEHCANVYRVERRDPPWRWLCIRHRRVEGFGFVTSSTWDDAPPYLYCRDVNGGQCPLYTPIEPKSTEAIDDLTMEFAK